MFVGISLRMLKTTKRFIRRHPVIAFMCLMFAMWASEQEKARKKSPHHNGD